MYDTMLTAEDISILLRKLKYDDSLVTIIGSPEQLFIALKDDLKKKIKTYICYINQHWFTIIYTILNNKKYIITWDSFGNQLPNTYKTKLIELRKDFHFLFCSEVIQSDGHSCGLFAVIFTDFVIQLYKYKKEEFLELLAKVKKNHILKIFNSIKNCYK